MKHLLVFSAIAAAAVNGFGLTTDCPRIGLKTLEWPMVRPGNIIDAGTFTDGKSGVSCPANQLGAGAFCQGKYCDDVTWQCSGISDDIGRSYEVTEIGGYTRQTTDGKPPAICNPNRVMVGMSCSGRYCDDMQIQCASVKLAEEVSEIASHSEVQFGQTPDEGCDWTAYFSEEDLGQTCPQGKFPRGLACTGRYCDNMAIYCCPGKHFACGHKHNSHDDYHDNNSHDGIEDYDESHNNHRHPKPDNTYDSDNSNGQHKDEYNPKPSNNPWKHGGSGWKKPISDYNRNKPGSHSGHGNKDDKYEKPWDNYNNGYNSPSEAQGSKSKGYEKPNPIKPIDTGYQAPAPANANAYKPPPPPPTNAYKPPVGY